MSRDALATQEQRDICRTTWVTIIFWVNSSSCLQQPACLSITLEALVRQFVQAFRIIIFKSILQIRSINSFHLPQSSLTFSLFWRASEGNFSSIWDLATIIDPGCRHFNINISQLFYNHVDTPFRPTDDRRSRTSIRLLHHHRFLTI